MESVLIKIPAELFAVAESSRFEGTLSCDHITCGIDRIELTEPLLWEVDVSNVSGALLVQGKVRTVGVTECARCLEPAQVLLDGTVEGSVLLSAQSVLPDDVDPDEVVVLPEDHVLDIAPFIQSALIMALPNPPLCSDDCKGLCPSCGANLNEGSCACDALDFEDSHVSAENPFAVLAHYEWDNS